MPLVLNENVLIPLRVAVPLAQFGELKAKAALEGVPLAALVRRLLGAGMTKENGHDCL
jgi:hypothetical protein